MQPADEFAMVRALDPMASFMDAGAAARALRIARAVHDPGARARILAVLSRATPEGERPALLEEALVAARSIRDPWRRVRALVPTALRMPEEAREVLARETLDAVMSIQGDWLRGRALALLRRIATGEVRRRALEAALALNAPNERASALSAYAGDLSAEERERLLSQAESIRDEWLCHSVLTSLAEHLPRPSIERAVGIARRLHGAPRALSLASLGYRISDWDPLLREEALAEARDLPQVHERAETLTGLLAEMPAEFRAQPAAEAVDSACAVSDPAIRALLLADLIEFVPRGRLADVLRETGNAARQIEDRIVRAEQLGRVIPYLEEAEQSGAINEVLILLEG